MKAIRILQLLVLSLLFVACDILSVDQEILQSEKVKLAKSSMYEPRKEQSILPGNYGKYLNYFNDCDNLIGISASKPSALNSHRVKGYCGPNYMRNTKSSEICTFDVMVNDVPFSRSASTKSGFNDQEFFGRDVKFSISSKYATKSTGEGVDVEMYVPEMISIIKPQITNEKELIPLCYYDGFVLEWNADPYNKNGVIVIFEWIGNMVIGQDIPDTYIRRVGVFEDNGTCVLPISLFEGVPDTAVCHLTILRGNIESVNLSGESFNVMADSHEFLTFVLIREVKRI